jgi:putative DNA primase/helicase
MLEQAQSEPGIPIMQKQLDANPYLFNVANGTINLRTGELHPHDPHDLITRMSPVEYDPNATSELWEDFISWVTNDKQDFADYLQKAVGYSLTGDTGEEKLFMLLGAEATGKSTFAESIKAMLGDYAKTADFESFLQRSFTGGIRNDIASLAGARFVVSIEVDEGAKLAEGLVKTITGGDTISARFLHQEFFEFVPQFKLWLAANDAPKVNADDGAMWRRIVRLPFERIIPKERRDPGVKAMLRDPGISGPAILAWAVKGCLAWQVGGLGEPDVITKATAAYRIEQDPLNDFIEDTCNVKAEAWVSSGNLRKMYNDWCVKSGEKPINDHDMAKLLTARGFEKTRNYANGRGWQGIGLIEKVGGL